MAVFDQDFEGGVESHSSGLGVRVDRSTVGAVVIVVTGDLDLSTVESFSSRCEREIDSELFVVDLRAATFVALCGAVTLENLGRQVQAHGSRFRIVLGGQEACRALEAAGTGERYVCVTRLEEAQRV